jgi:hypothetical protein
MKYRVAVLCSEENPIYCHRRLLVGRVLTARGISISHIRGDGRLQSDDDLEREGQASNPHQVGLFEGSGEEKWRSIQSVLRRGQPPTSSEL